MRNETPHSVPRKRRGRLIAAVLLATIVVAAGFGAWQYWRGLSTRRVVLTGVRYADRKEVLALSGLDRPLRMKEIDATAVTTRLRRHAWIRDARLQRTLNGTVRLQIVERVPVALAMSSTGRPESYLDAYGFVLPLAGTEVFDVPLLRGVRLPDAKGRPVDAPEVRELLAALGRTPETTDVLLSDFELKAKGDVWLYTKPAPDGGSVPVRLGNTGFAEKLRRLEAFWYQAVQNRPGHSYEIVDLRFDGQVVTKESSTADSAAAARSVPPTALASAQPGVTKKTTKH